jgi:putative heme-binding domain-containing protein
MRQISLLRALAEGLAQRALPLTETLRASLTAKISAMVAGTANSEWFNTPLPEAQATPSPWVPQPRTHRDGTNASFAISSLSPGGERLGGILHSPDFTLPAELSFWMCGHNGPPNGPDRKLNYARLVLDDGTEVARSYPPRNDIAERYEWKLGAYAGSRGHVEIVDAITDIDGFAWIAVSRFEPAVINVPEEPVGAQGSFMAELYRLAGTLKLSDLEPLLIQAAGAANPNLNTRLAATEALSSLQPELAIAPLAMIIDDSDMPLAVREQGAQQLGRIDRPEARLALLNVLKSAPESVAILIASGVAGKPESAQVLLAEIRAGRASAALLREPAVVDRLKSSSVPNVERQIEELTAGLSPADDRIAKLIAERRSGFLAGQFDADAGRAVFAKSICAECHRVADVGKTIGPALDGIGNRGLDRLLEDTLNPSRNVDIAFRTVLVETEGGQVISGFGVREEGQSLVLYDSNGKQITIPMAEVAKRHQSSISPMPSNIIEQMPGRDYYSLLAYLLSLRGK